MKALVHHGPDQLPKPGIPQPGDTIVRITKTTTFDKAMQAEVLKVIITNDIVLSEVMQTETVDNLVQQQPIHDQIVNDSLGG
jgi:hypothetical protein